MPYELGKKLLDHRAFHLYTLYEIYLKLKIMALFSFVFSNILGILLNVIVGYIAGKYGNVSKKSIATLLIYFVAPITFFPVASKVKIDLYSASIILVVLLIASFVSIISYYFFKKIYQDNTANLLAMSSGAANTSYFMLPLAIKLFDTYALGVYMTATIGIVVYIYTFGYYFCARSTYSIKESLVNMIKLPVISGFLLGCVFEVCGFTIPNFILDFSNNMRYVYSVLGMIMLGLAISNIKNFEINKKFTSLSFLAKFALYPLAVNCFVIIDKYFLGIYNTELHNVLQLIAMAPMSANVIALSTTLNLNSEKVATTVLLSTFFALFYVPIMATFLLNDLQIRYYLGQLTHCIIFVYLRIHQLLIGSSISIQAIVDECGLIVIQLFI